jgi:hypothetical protein
VVPQPGKVPVAIIALRTSRKLRESHPSPQNFSYVALYVKRRVVVKALCCKPEGRGFKS